MTSSVEILNWINNFGFVEAIDIANKFNKKIALVYQKLKQLSTAGYLQNQKLIYGSNTIYFLTKTGIKLAQSPLPLLKNINLATYHHNLLVVKVSTLLVNKYKAQFITERQLKHEQKLKGHISDGLLLFDNKQIAIELELSPKSKIRRNSILKFYLRNFAFDEVWYICKNQEIKNQLIPFTTKMFFLKLMDLTDILNNKS